MAIAPEIFVEARDVAGQTVTFPSCERAALFARIAGTRHLSTATLGLIQKLGFRVTDRAGQSGTVQSLFG